MEEIWSYDKSKRRDRKGRRWHFVTRLFLDPAVPFEERPYELYFRDDARTEFGLLRFDRQKDSPYRDYETMVNKIMNNPEFRQTLRDPETEAIWQGSWK